MVRNHGGHRRLLRAGALAVGGAKASAHGGAQDSPRCRRRGPACASAALLAHPVRDQKDDYGGVGRSGEGVAKTVGWAKALFAPCPPSRALRLNSVGMARRARLCPPYKSATPR